MCVCMGARVLALGLYSHIKFAMHIFWSMAKLATAIYADLSGMDIHIGIHCKMKLLY